MNNQKTSVSDAANSYVLTADLFGSDHRTERIMHHFLNDTKGKFVLSCEGNILLQNIEAANIINAGILSPQPDSKLSYGSSKLSSAAEDILEQMRLGRASKKKLLKKHEDDWIVFEFSSPEINADKEVLLTVYKRNVCHEDSFEALSRAFDFTITEAVVVRHISMAHCPKEISAEMDISINTVRAHLRSIYAKIGVRGYNRSLRVILQLIS